MLKCLGIMVLGLSYRRASYRHATILDIFSQVQIQVFQRHKLDCCCHCRRRGSSQCRSSDIGRLSGLSVASWNSMLHTKPKGASSAKCALCALTANDLVASSHALHFADKTGCKRYDRFVISLATLAGCLRADSRSRKLPNAVSYARWV